VAIETLTTLYTTEAEIDSIFSEDGVTFRFDDDGDDAISAGIEADSLADVIAEATDEVNFYTQTRYAAADLANNLWVRRAASYIAANLASARRGNPEQYADKVSRLRDRLQLVLDKKMHIPRMPIAYDDTPGMSNLVVDDRFPKSKLRVEIENSVGTYPDQDIDRPGLAGVDI